MIIGNSEADIKKTDDFNEFMVKEGAFKRGEDGLIYVNADYKYNFSTLLSEYKNR